MEIPSSIRCVYACKCECVLFLPHHSQATQTRKSHETTTRWVGHWRKVCVCVCVRARKRQRSIPMRWLMLKHLNNTWIASYRLSHFGNFRRLIRYQNSRNVSNTFGTVAKWTIHSKSSFVRWVLSLLNHNHSLSVHTQLFCSAVILSCKHREKNYRFGLSDNNDNSITYTIRHTFVTSLSLRSVNFVALELNNAENV